MGSRDANAQQLLVRPIPGLGRAGILLLVVVTVVLFGSLYLVTIPDGVWALVLGLQVISLTVAALLLARFTTAQMGVADGTVSERIFPNPTTYYPIEDIDRLFLAEVYVSSTTDTYLHLVAVDAAGRRIFRMRSKYWVRDDIHRVAMAIGVPVTNLGRPLTQRELTARITRA